MKILMVNNRLKIYGGEGTYMTSVGDELIRQGHDVQYFGLKDDKQLHVNRYNIYAKKSKNPFKIFKNSFNRKQFAKILDVFKPDVIHINLIYFTLTPSILIEAKKRRIPVVQTIHDGKIVCPSYQLFIEQKNVACTICKNGDFKKCYKNKCMKNSSILSYLAYREAKYNHKRGYYNLVDRFIFPSHFMEKLHIDFGIEKKKTIVLQNFTRITHDLTKEVDKQNYFLFFGRIINIKGVRILFETIKLLPNVQFVIAGDGDLKKMFDNLHNCRVVGFQDKESLIKLIENAYASIFPSICLENCPMGIAESINLGTPVIGSNIGGIPEMISNEETGLLFESGNTNSLVDSILKLINDKALYKKMSEECQKRNRVFTVETYCHQLIDLYKDLTRRT